MKFYKDEIISGAELGTADCTNRREEEIDYFGWNT
jgi:hypothetical protein